MKDTDKSKEDLINELVLLRKEKDLSDKFLDLTGSMLVILNADKEVTFINKKGCQVLGYNKEEVIGKNWFDNFLPERIKKEAAKIAAKIFSGNLETVECFQIPLRCKSGKERIISWHSTFLKNETGDIVSVLSSGEDITEFKEAEQKIKDSEEKLRNILKNSTNLFYAHDVEHNLTYLSPQIEEMLGYTQEEAMVKWTDLVSDNPINKRGFEYTLKAIETGSPQPPYELELVHKNGDKVFVEVREGPVVVDGKTVSMVGALMNITQYKRAEEQLRKQKYILEKAQSVGMLGSWEFNIKEDTLNWSDEVFRIFGIEPGTMLTYELFLDRIHPDDREYVDRKWKAALNKEPYDIEHRILVDGKIKWVREKAELEFDENGDCFGYIGFTQDITEKKNTQDVLLDSLERHRLFVENSPLGIIHYSFKGIITDVNDALIEILGEPREKLIGLDLNIVPNKNFSKEVLKSLNGNKGYFEGPFALHAGEKQAELNAHLIPIIVDGKVHSGVGIVEDITERKKLEQHIKASEAFLANIFASIQDGISVLDKDLNIVRVNEIMKKWYAHAMPLVGKKCFEAYHGRSKMCEICPTVRAFNSGETQSDRVPKIGAYGKVTGWLDLYAFPLRDDTGEIRCVIENVRDITEQIKAEERAKRLLIEKAAAGVEQRKAEELFQAYRKIKETQEQLIQAEKLAGIGRLGAGVAHELNSPLTGLLSLLRSYRKEKDPSSEEYADLAEMEKACLHMAHIIKGLNVFARQATDELEPVNCNKLIDDTLSFSKHVFKSDYVHIEKNYTEDLFTVMASKNQIQQVVLNMITNACDAISGKGVFKIITRNIREDNKKKWVEMEFADTGCGISKENLDKIFNPFFTTKRPGGGVGLGLSIAHKIVENHKGKITVDSKEGQGTVFTVRLPVGGEGGNEQS